MKLTTTLTLLSTLVMTTVFGQDQPRFLPQRWQDGDKVTIQSQSTVKIWMGDSLIKEKTLKKNQLITIKEDHKGFVMHGAYSANPKAEWDEMPKTYDTLAAFQEAKAAMFNKLEATWDKYKPVYRIDKSSSLATGWYNEDEFIEENEESFNNAVDAYVQLLEQLVDSIPAEDKEDHAYDELEDYRDMYMDRKIDELNSFLRLWTLKYQPYKVMKLPTEVLYFDMLGDVVSEQYYSVYQVDSKMIAGNKAKLTITEEVPNDVLFNIHKGANSREAKLLTKREDLKEEHKDEWLVNLNTSWPEEHKASHKAIYGQLRIEVETVESWELTRQEE